MTKLSAFAVVVGAALLMYAWENEVGFSEDSISYLSATRSLQDTGTMRDIDGSYFVAWAPLYPLIATVMEAFPCGGYHCKPVEEGLGFFNLLMFIFTAISSWILISKAIEKPFFRTICLFFILFSFTIMQVYAVALTEAPFLFLINCILLFGTRDERRGKSDYVVLGIFCALALSLRYAGIFLLPVVLVFLFWKNERKVAIWKALVFLGIAILPLDLWLGRNWLLTGTLTGFRPSGDLFFLKNVTVLADTITSWILPIQIPLLLRLAALGILVVLLGKTFLQKNNRVHLLLIASYLLFLVVAYLFFSFEEPRDRLLAPMFISFSILLFSGLEQLAGRFSLSRSLVVAVVCLWMIYPAVRIVKHIQLWHKEGVEVYNKKHWNDSPTIAWLKENYIPEKIFSNDAYAVYYFARKNAFRVPKSFYRFDQLNETVHDGDYLVWWKGREYYDLKLVEVNYNLKEEKQFDDATIFRMHKVKNQELN